MAPTQLAASLQDLQVRFGKKIGYQLCESSGMLDLRPVTATSKHM
jgi:hypothetical protein